MERNHCTSSTHGKGEFLFSFRVWSTSSIIMECDYSDRHIQRLGALFVCPCHSYVIHTHTAWSALPAATAYSPKLLLLLFILLPPSSLQLPLPLLPPLKLSLLHTNTTLNTTTTKDECDMSSKFIEHIDSPQRLSSYDVRLEDVLAHQEAITSGHRSRSSTFSSSKASLVDRGRELSTSSLASSSSSSSASPRWKRLSHIMAPKRTS